MRVRVLATRDRALSTASSLKLQGHSRPAPTLTTATLAAAGKLVVRSGRE